MLFIRRETITTSCSLNWIENALLRLSKWPEKPAVANISMDPVARKISWHIHISHFQISASIFFLITLTQEIYHELKKNVFANEIKILVSVNLISLKQFSTLARFFFLLFLLLLWEWWCADAMFYFVFCW